MRHFLIIFCFVILVSETVYADEINVESIIKAATVYSDRATVTRNAEIKIPKGSHNLIFEGLPVGLFYESLRVSGSSEAEVTFGALSIKRETSQDYVVPRVQELQTKIKDIENLIEMQNAERQALVEANELLKTWGKQTSLSKSEDTAKIHLDHDKWISASDGLSGKMLSNLKGIINLDLKIGEASEKIEKIQGDLRQIRSKGKQSYTVTIPFESNKAATLEVDLSYQISKVSWRPIYDARLDVKSKTLKLVQYGSVSQNTGEDWTDIALTLSTARPSRGAQLPGLFSKWVSIYVPPPPRTKKPNDDAFEFEKSAGSAIPVPIEAPDTRLEVPEIQEEGEDPLHRWRLLQEERVERQMSAKSKSVHVEPMGETYGYVGEYKISGASTVKADGTQAKLMISEFEPSVDLQVQIRPQFSTDAYLVSKIKLQSDTPLLPGRVSLFRDGAFIGQMKIAQMIRPNEEAELAFGIDDGVVVKRNILKDQSSESGLISKDSVVEKRYITEIQNLHKDTIQIEVAEMLPASKDQSIRVDILPDTTSGYQTDLNNVKGTISWTGPLESQQKTAINLGWKVSWPNAKDIVGLNQFE